MGYKASGKANYPPCVGPHSGCQQRTANTPRRTHKPCSHSTYPVTRSVRVLVDCLAFTPSFGTATHSLCILRSSCLHVSLLQSPGIPFDRPGNLVQSTTRSRELKSAIVLDWPNADPTMSIQLPSPTMDRRHCGRWRLERKRSPESNHPEIRMQGTNVSIVGQLVTFPVVQW